jgi:hypothetical protein
MPGHWLVTPRRGKSHTFKTTKAMVAYVRKHHGCMISWIRSR